MLIDSEAAMLQYGQDYAKSLKTPAVIELIGDVGAGKTTFTRGLAKGLGVEDELSSPSFTISREYRGKKANLVHYDFYRLDDPGLMSEDLAESIADHDTVTVIEWGQSISEILPAEHRVIEIKYVDENTREIIEK
jgi:tRNA threonylcarbamoyladenosine biosynthesis protein TsaE